MEKKIIVLFAFVLMIINLSGCTTNAIIDPNKIEKKKILVSQTEFLEQEIVTVKQKSKHELEELERYFLELQDKLEKETGVRDMYLENIQDGIRLTILNKVVFSSGKAEINNAGKALLSKVSSILKNRNKSISVIGHTDNKPIKSKKYLYKSNWELSLVRAVNVVHFFEANGVDPTKMTAVGYGEYRPVDTNATSKGRKNNRRVEIVIGNDIKRLDLSKNIEIQKKRAI